MKRYYIEYEVVGRSKSIAAVAKNKKDAAKQVQEMYGSAVNIKITKNNHLLQ